MATTPPPPTNSATAWKRLAGARFSSCPATKPAIKFPSAAATNQIPIIWLTRLLGDSLVIEESPTGDKQSSPTVCKKYITISQAGETKFELEALADPHANTKNPAESPKSPRANFIGIDGLAFLLANHVHIKPKIGAKITIKEGFINCNVLAGICHPFPT